MRGHRIASAPGDSTAFDRLFGKSPSILLVRPDGYVAFTGAGEAMPDLARYCDQWLVPASPAAKAEVRHA